MILLDNKPLCTDSRFPDATLALRIETGVAVNKNDVRCITWHYESDIEMSVLYYVTKHLKSVGFSVVLFLPYIPNARMDRVKNSDEIFTLKYFAEFINSLEFETVYTIDPHSNVSCALINNLQVDNGFEYIISAIDKIDDKELVLFYPDEGAMKRYSEIIKDIPYAFGVKERDWRSGDILGLKMMNEDIVKGKNVLIVDDICSRGGTFYHSAKALKEAGAADVYLYVTHCEKTIFKGDLINSDLIKHIFTTRSIFMVAHEKITVLS